MAVNPQADGTVEYECALCGKVFVSRWSDAEAMAELQRNFGPATRPEDCAVVCDDCCRSLPLPH